MLNQIILVGRLVQDLEIKKLENGNKVSYITLAVKRSYKNSEGIYETDFIPCIVWNKMAEMAEEFCKKGDIIEVRGRLETREENDKYITEVIVEKVTFLSSEKERGEE